MEVKSKPVHYFLASGGCLVVAALCLVLQIQSQPATSSSVGSNPQRPNAQLATPIQVTETPPTTKEKATHIVPARHPRYLTIAELNLDNARILSVDVNKEGQIGSPANVHDVGWFTGSAKPGQPGTVFIDGHVAGPNEPGVFEKLKQLDEGDSIIIETGNGQKTTYAVDSVEQVAADAVDMDKVLSHEGSNDQGLALMTCGGQFDRAKNAYHDRVIVYASPVQ